MAGNRTRVDCLEGNHANHYTTIAHVKRILRKRRIRTNVLGFALISLFELSLTPQVRVNK
jgi:hypothetical protein